MAATATTLCDLIEAQAQATPAAAAILAPERQSLSYQALWIQTQTTVAALNRFGVGRGDRVALIVPNGPDAASAFVTIACGAVCAPLDPNYRFKEFERTLRELRAKAVVIEKDSDSPALEAATKLGIPVLELCDDCSLPAGAFSIQGAPTDPPMIGGFARADDVALLLHVSPTADAPEAVSLTHADLCAAAGDVASSMELSPEDRCLNFMPLFHIDGLLGTLLPSLYAGAQVVCAQEFQVSHFLSWLDEFEPSWYSAEPKEHQAILSAMSRKPPALKATRLRLIRSTSEALPPGVSDRLQTLFRCPVIASLGATKAI